MDARIGTTAVVALRRPGARRAHLTPAPYVITRTARPKSDGQLAARGSSTDRGAWAVVARSKSSVDQRNRRVMRLHSAAYCSRSPVTVAATAACVVNAVSYNAVRMGIPVEGLVIRVRSKVDPRVLFAIRGPEDHGACLGQVEYDVDVQGDISDAQLDFGLTAIEETLAAG